MTKKSSMTYQNQSSERDRVIQWIENTSPVDVAEAFIGRTKQRDELAAEVTGLKAELDIGKSFHDLAVKERDLERIRVDRLTAERDQALKVLEREKQDHRDFRNKMGGKIRALKAESAAREIAMRDRAAEVARKHLGPNPFCQEEIRALAPQTESE